VVDLSPQTPDLVVLLCALIRPVLETLLSDIMLFAPTTVPTETPLPDIKQEEAQTRAGA
jgi:hypothetical protein